MALIIKFSSVQYVLYYNNSLTLLCYFAVGPTNVEILNGREPLSAGKRYEVKCQSIGARPPPTVTWWLGGKQVCLQQFMTYTNLPQSYYIITGCDKYVLTYSSKDQISILIETKFCCAFIHFLIFLQIKTNTEFSVFLENLLD